MARQGTRQPADSSTLSFEGVALRGSVILQGAASSQGVSEMQFSQGRIRTLIDWHAAWKEHPDTHDHKI